ncbi:DNA packaging terminase subunit 2-like protein [Phocid alphaherpesvirus 1]|uniref:DNA packaging terminase subunit 2-like protein n=2 Tax=Phocid alphaherpesvirus 1 TaxID=47418 RepID=A0A482F3J7_9ALPH|nr:DNA packaging terminase subunit 2-like protein [Phocid alphaherpesvirus 1]QBN85149.1 DNA packaging terminase subunit 2-like protein [Phocid alphaherpesvirus 1]UNP64252.1 DNA packaging terminase subunit 2-like protein [Phocid alphaherpesvirus 1]
MEKPQNICGAVTRQKILVILGQIQAYIFQVELLKRCDPSVSLRYLRLLKLNALTVRFIKNQVFSTFEIQSRQFQTSLIFAVELTIRYALFEGERLISSLLSFTEHKSEEQFFKETMNLNSQCKYHKLIELATYGGNVFSEIKYLHDIENFLKQLNYCHLITPSDSALTALNNIKDFMSKTIGGGFVVPPELFDPTNPCSVCFEELCVTANQGEAVHRRLLNCTCNHITQQIPVNIKSDDLRTHLPYIHNLNSKNRKDAESALKMLYENNNLINKTNVAVECDHTDRVATEILESHNVFKPASRCLYAVSELKFWLASANEGDPRQRTIDIFTDNLKTLSDRERYSQLETVTAELALFNKHLNHFDRVFGENLDFDVIDNMLTGGCTISPDDQINALIRACYDHHMSTPLIQQLTDPDKGNKEALKLLLERVGMSEDEDSLTPNKEEDTTLSNVQSELNGNVSSNNHSWGDLLSRAISDVTQRRRLYTDRLCKRSIASLGRCVREQRKELEKTLRVNVYGDVLLHTYVAVCNGFYARKNFNTSVLRAGTIIDNRISTASFDSHRFMKASILRHSVDPSLLPSLTHKFFELVNGPLFDNDRHNFAQPPNTAFYFSVENVGLLPHLKEELARFMITSKRGDWVVSEFQKFYYFEKTDGVTATQRLSWKYIRELILASAIFSSVFHCGEVKILRADRTYPDSSGHQLCPPGIYITYEESCPLVAVLESNSNGVIGSNTTVIYDSDIFSLLYTVLQKLAPGLNIN